jgi:hypothetical protein
MMPVGRDARFSKPVHRVDEQHDENQKNNGRNNKTSENPARNPEPGFVRRNRVTTFRAKPRLKPRIVGYREEPDERPKRTAKKRQQKVEDVVNLLPFMELVSLAETAIDRLAGHAYRVFLVAASVDFLQRRGPKV